MILNKIRAGFILAFTFFLTLSSCESGLTYTEAPESTYSEVGISKFSFKSRELFKEKIFAVNWNKWVPEYMNDQYIGETLVADLVIEEDANLPEGKLYVINVELNNHATYKTSNKGYLFDGSKFTGSFELISPSDNRSEEVKLPVRKNEIIGEMYLVSTVHCIVEPQGDAPKLGIPADFSKPHRYLVKNVSYLPKGVERFTRMYEVRVTFKP